ncbi:MAG TPA: hypothetical protein VMS17_13320 [Gemmataceae bacterium]|nr:hypothetical protein [Gemmataceae bacterium]
MPANSGNRGGNRAGRKEVLALGLAAGKTIRQAAKAAGVSERTAGSWWAEPDFRLRVSEMRGEVVVRALGRMTDALTAAADTLRKLLRSKNDSVRLGAARSLIELTLKVREGTDLAAQVMELYRDLKDEKTGAAEGRRQGRTYGDDPHGPGSKQAFDLDELGGAP